MILDNRCFTIIRLLSRNYFDYYHFFPMMKIWLATQHFGAKFDAAVND